MREVYLRTYVGVLTALASALVASWIYWNGLTIEPRFVLGAAIFAGLVLLGDAFPLRISERYALGAWDIGLILAIAILGPTWTALAALPSAFFVGRRDWLRTAYEISHSTTIIFLAGIVFSFVSEPLLTSDHELSASVVYGTIVAGIVLLAANKTTITVLFKVKYNQAFHKTWEDLIEPYLFSDVVTLLTVGAGVLTLLASGPVAAVTVIGGSVASMVLVYRSREQAKEIRELEARAGSLQAALTTSNMTFGAMMIQELGRKDGYTHRHAAATAVYAADLAREMKMDEARAERLRMAGLLHNIGLFGMPEELLLATGKLNSIAQHQLAEHPVRGEKALAAVPEFEEMAGWVRWHHERPDGRGYPDKLRGSWIPLEAKILAVSQAYAAMVLDQPHRPGLGFAEAREELGAGIDTEFDGVVVRALLRLLDTESEGYRRADDHRFVFPVPESRGGARLDVPDLRTQDGLGQILPRNSQ